jgi:hypothetical protein
MVHGATPANTGPEDGGETSPDGRRAADTRLFLRRRWIVEPVFEFASS